MELFCKYDSKQDKKQVESGEYILTSEQRQMIEYVETGLCLDGSAYIYEMLKREVQCEKTLKR